jgi:hypothetical protein
MNSLKTLLNKLDSTLQKYNSVNYKKLQAPLPEKEIDQYLKRLGVDDQNFKLLYSWKNGVDNEDGVQEEDQIFNFGSLVSLQYLFKNPELNQWEKKFISIVSDGSGQAILFNNEKDQDYGRLHMYSVPLLFIRKPISFYDSIESMVETTIQAYKQNAFVYDEKEEFLNIDFDRFNKIATDMNPNSDYWKVIKE